MRIGIVSYSYTGNNEKLAERLAKTLNAKHVKIRDKREVTVKSITYDILLKRKPQNKIEPNIIEEFDFIIYLAPFWLGKIARPLVPFLKFHKQLKIRYSFITVSGGSLGKNSKYQKELIKRTKKEPLFCKEFYIVDLMKNSNAKVKDTSAYLISDIEVIQMTQEIITKLQEVKIIK